MSMLYEDLLLGKVAIRPSLSLSLSLWKSIRHWQIAEGAIKQIYIVISLKFPVS